MTDIHKLAQLIAACWRISGESPRIPTSHGLLDRALKKTYNNDDFPEWARELLHFSDSRIGLQCVEVPDILEWAQRSQLTSAPNPSYETAEVQISKKAAEQLLLRLNVDVDQAKRWGESLRSAMDTVEEQLAGLGSVMVEEY